MLLSSNNNNFYYLPNILCFEYSRNTQISDIMYTRPVQPSANKATAHDLCSFVFILIIYSYFKISSWENVVMNFCLVSLIVNWCNCRQPTDNRLSLFWKWVSKGTILRAALKVPFFSESRLATAFHRFITIGQSQMPTQISRSVFCFLANSFSVQNERQI